jgi:hypothetical protein
MEIRLEDEGCASERIFDKPLGEAYNNSRKCGEEVITHVSNLSNNFKNLCY